MFCSNCGAQNADTAKFCKACGTKLAGEAVAEVTAVQTAVVDTQRVANTVQPTPPAPPVHTEPMPADAPVAQEPQQQPTQPQKRKKRLVFVLILLVLLALGGGFAAWHFGVFGGQGSANSAAQTWQEQCDLGMRYLKDGDYQEAVIAFTAAIEIDPMQPEPYLNLAEAYVARGDLSAAIDVLQDGYDATEDDDIKQKLDELTAQKEAEELAALAPTPTPEPTATPEPTPEPTPDPNVVVSFNDATMENMVRMALAQPEGDITQGQLNDITQLYIYGEKTAALQEQTMGILSYGGGTLSDVSDLTKLPNLTTLTIRGNQVTDLTPLASMPQLVSLDVMYNGITDLTPLAGLTNLTSLQIQMNDITDLTPLAGLTLLTSLDAFSNEITDITPLAGLTKLTWLCLSGNNIQDITPLARLRNISYLDIANNNGLADITPLAGLTNLTDLWLQGNNISDLTPLAGLSQLDYLVLTENQTPITDWSPVDHVAEVSRDPY